MKKNNNKGFTLVELIVVLVILAILAAILVPALLGYIDKARTAQYEEEAHSILTASQAYLSQEYAKDPAATPVLDLSNTSVKNYINPIVTPTEVTEGSIQTGFASGVKGDASHAKFTVKGISGLKFKSQKGNNVEATIDNGEITITNY